MSLIALLREGKYNYGMMMMMIIIAMMIHLLNGMMVIKKIGPEGTNKGRTFPYCFASIKILGLVYVRRQKKKKQKNCGDKHEPFCV